MKSFVYLILKVLNDLNAVSKNRVGRRVGRRVYGKVTGGFARKLFK